MPPRKDAEWSFLGNAKPRQFELTDNSETAPPEATYLI
jgi:hypothetical protein